MICRTVWLQWCNQAVFNYMVLFSDYNVQRKIMNQKISTSFIKNQTNYILVGTKEKSELFVTESDFATYLIKKSTPFVFFYMPI